MTQPAQKVQAKKQSPARVYHCSVCFTEQDKWMGKCPKCGRHQTMLPGTKEENAKAKGEPRVIKDIEITKEHRVDSGTREFDRVLGGGLVEAGVVLIAGEPGKGKSTLCLQVACMLADAASDPCKVLYVSGEETESQIKARANRICKDPDTGKLPENLILLNEVDTNRIADHVMKLDPDVLFIDSIQMMQLGEGRAGSVTIIQDVTRMLVGISKARSMSTVIVGHVNSDGDIAGPKTLEHLVDTVLSFDEDRSSEIRILRCLKNRFGSTTEVGIFRMCEGGLLSVDNPEEFLMRGKKGIEGSCLACPMIKPGKGAGARPCIIEIEVLLGRTTDKPKMVVNGVGYEAKRLEMMLTIIQARTSVCAEPDNLDPEKEHSIGGRDIYLNIASPYQLEDRSLDLPVCMAVASALRHVPLPSGTIAWGELGLNGMVRPEGGYDARMAIVGEYGYSRPVASEMGEAISLEEALADFYELCENGGIEEEEPEDEEDEEGEDDEDEDGDETEEEKEAGASATLAPPAPPPVEVVQSESESGEAGEEAGEKKVGQEVGPPSVDPARASVAETIATTVPAPAPVMSEAPPTIPETS